MKNLFLRNPERGLVVVAVLVAMLVLPVMGSVAFATIGGERPAAESGIDTVGEAFGLIWRVFDILFWLLIILAAVFIILAAFAYLTAGGEPEKVQKANHRVLYAAVAVVIAVLAKTIPSIVCDFLGTDVQCVAPGGL